MNDQSRPVTPAHTDADEVPSEASQAAHEFAALIRANAQRFTHAAGGDTYEIRPCARVRGYILRVPVTRWRFWYPTAAAALGFARELTGLFRADCRVFDETGQVCTCGPIAELMRAANDDQATFAQS